MGMIHFLGFALSYGVCIWVTFISSNILAGAMPKQQFAMVQSKIYPLYFKTMAYGVATAFFGHFMSQRHRYYYANRAETIQGFLFFATICMTLINLFVLEPRASKVCGYFLCFSFLIMWTHLAGFGSRQRIASYMHLINKVWKILVPFRFNLCDIFNIHFICLSKKKDDKYLIFSIPSILIHVNYFLFRRLKNWLFFIFKNILLLYILPAMI